MACLLAVDFGADLRSATRRVPALEQAPTTLGADLWDLESARVKVLLERAEAANKLAEAARKQEKADGAGKAEATGTGAQNLKKDN